MNHTYLRGDMYYADLGHGIGSEQEGYRPVVIIQNNVGNKHALRLLSLLSQAKRTQSRNYLPTTTSTPKTAWNCPLSSFWNNCEPWISVAWVTLSVTCPKSIYTVSITLWQSVSVWSRAYRKSWFFVFAALVPTISTVRALILYAGLTRSRPRKTPAPIVISEKDMTTRLSRRTVKGAAYGKSLVECKRNDGIYRVGWK